MEANIIHDKTFQITTVRGGPPHPGRLQSGNELVGTQVGDPKHVWLAAQLPAAYLKPSEMKVEKSPQPQILKIPVTLPFPGFR